MKKLTMIIISIFAVNFLFAQQASYSEFKAGMVNPKDAKTGWMFTYGTGKTIDEAFSWLVEFNLYKKTYNKDGSFLEIIASNVFNTHLSLYQIRRLR